MDLSLDEEGKKKKENKCYLAAGIMLLRSVARACGVDRPNVVMGATPSDTYTGVRP